MRHPSCTPPRDLSAGTCAGGFFDVSTRGRGSRSEGWGKEGEWRPWGGGRQISSDEEELQENQTKQKLLLSFFSFLFFCDFYLFRFYESLTCDIDLLDSLLRLRS